MESVSYIEKRANADFIERETLFESAKQLENEDRRCFSQTRDGWEVAGREDLSSHPHPSLIPLFDKSSGKALDAFRIDEPTVQDCDPYFRAFPLQRSDREGLSGKSSIVPTLTEFKANFSDVFCEGLLRYMDWSNVFAAGGGVLACAQPVPEQHGLNHTTKRKYFHDLQYSASDVDLFLYGLDAEQAKQKLIHIYKAVTESCPQTVACFRSAHAVTLVSQYPFRHIQIVLRLYSSPYEVLAGFDVDACTVGFDGAMVYADVRAHHALVTRRNTIDLTRRSPSYEMRLAKYGVRGFEVEVKNLDRDMVDPGIFERPWASLEGLAKLLVLETLRTPEQRSRFFEMQKLQREGGEANSARYSRRGRALDAKTQERVEESLGGSAEVSNYSTVFLPWGREHSAESTMRLMAKKDHKLNNKWFTRERPYRLHPCFFGTAEEILRDCSPDDPPFPEKKPDESATLKEHRETYVRGPLGFIVDDPGRQRIGSFHPLSEEGWSEGVYFHATTEALFAAVNANDVARVKEALKSVPQCDIRDFFGRTALHLSLIAGANETAELLLGAGSSPLEPMAGGRTVFHLAAMYGRVDLIPSLASAAEKLFAAKQNGSDAAENAKKLRLALRQLVRARDNDAGLSPLQMALLFGRLDCAKALVTAGASLISEPSAGKEGAANRYLLVGLLPSEVLADGISFLVKHGYACADRWEGHELMSTELLWLLENKDELAIEALARLDPSFKKACTRLNSRGTYPLQLAVELCLSPKLISILLSSGCPTTCTPDMFFDLEQVCPHNWFLKQAKEKCYSMAAFAAVVLGRALVNLVDAAAGSTRTRATYYWRPVDARNQVRADLKAEEYRDTLERFNSTVDELQQQLDRAAETCVLLAGCPSLDEPSPTIMGNWQMRYSRDFEWDAGFWLDRGDLKGNDTPTVSAREFNAYSFGTLLRLASDRLAGDSVADPNGKILNPDPEIFDRLSFELEELCRLSGRKHTEELLRGWRIAHASADKSSLGATDKGMDSALFERFKANKVDLLARVVGIVRGVIKATSCPHDIVEYYEKKPLVYDVRRRANGVSYDLKPIPGKPLFPTELLFGPDCSSEETRLKDFFLAKELSSVLPDPLPRTFDRTMQNEAWLLAGMQRNLFRMAARSYLRLDENSMNSYWDNELTHKRRFPSASLAVFPLNLQSRYDALFALCREGKTSDVVKLCTESDLLVTSADLEGRTPFDMAILAGNVDLIAELVTLAKLQHKSLKKKDKKKREGAERMDNFELMEESEGESGDSDEASDVDDNEEEEAEDDDDGAARKEGSTDESRINGEKAHVLFCMSAAYHISDLPNSDAISTSVRALRDEFSSKFPSDEAAAGIVPFVRLTPLQLAVVIGSLPVVKMVLSQAKGISPNLVRSMMMHSFDSSQGSRNVFDLAVALDRVEVLQLLISEAGYGLPFDSLASQYKQVSWKYRAADSVDTSATKETPRKDVYAGLSSELSGTQKRMEELKRNPGLQRLDRIPNPTSTLMHKAAWFGSPRCLRFLTGKDPERSLLSACGEFMALPDSRSIRELLARMRQSAPVAFAKRFGAEISVENDALIVIYNFLGGDEALPDIQNLQAIHAAVLNGQLAKLLDAGYEFDGKNLARLKEGTISFDEQVTFNKFPLPGLGEFLPGGSPLHLASFLGRTDDCTRLVESLGFESAQSDDHWAGVSAFHVALHAKQWDTAQVLAKGVDAQDLLQRSPLGITPVMTAARAGTLRGLLALIPALQEGAHPIERDVEGASALHMAATARYAETLRTLMDWAGKGLILAEDFTTGRTALDCALSALAVEDPGAMVKDKYASDNIAAAQKRAPKDAKHREQVTDARLTAKQASERLLDRPRVRAQFPLVRPARERRLRQVTGVDVGADEALKTAKKDFVDFWGWNAHNGDLSVFTTAYGPFVDAADMICDCSFVNVPIPLT